MMRHFLLLLFLTYISTSLAFTTHARTNNLTFLRPSQSKTVLLAGGESEKEGGAAIAKPKVGVETKQVTKQKSKSVEKRKSKTSDPISRREDEFEDAPLFKVILIGDESYEQAHVIERLCEIMEDMDENRAATIFKQAQQGGQAMCGKYPLEHAEMYKEQLIRSDPMIYSDVEEENKKK
jgi:ATP-dependent Clp protease adapter protein ClpS